MIQKKERGREGERGVEGGEYELAGYIDSISICSIVDKENKGFLLYVRIHNACFSAFASPRSRIRCKPHFYNLSLKCNLVIKYPPLFLHSPFQQFNHRHEQARQPIPHPSFTKNNRSSRLPPPSHLLPSQRQRSPTNIHPLSL